MGTESERCVDDLMAKVSRADEILQRIEAQTSEELVAEAREFVTSTQTFIDNNKVLIPGYCLKKASDSLRRLETKINEPQKTKLSFKFKSKAVVDPPAPVTDQTTIRESQKAKEPTATPMSFGFSDRHNQNLCLGPSEVELKDVSLSNLTGCTVLVFGLANTIYVNNLTDTSVTVLLASRAIKLVNCHDCTFRLVCQQLRIDSTTSCEFEVFTSSGSMLESSSKLKFKCLNPETLTDMKASERASLLTRANFDTSTNKWRSIDDFDWLVPDKPSKNYSIEE